MFYLLIRPLGGAERRVPLGAGVASVGRFAGNAIVLDEFGVSGRHAELEVSGAEVLVRDLSSTNGLFVNGRRVESATLRPGDRVLVGSVVAVLQEALSDRIQLLPRGEVREERPSLLERAYVPTSRDPRDDRRDDPGEEPADPASALRLLREILGEVAPGGPDGVRRGLGAAVRFASASEGFVVLPHDGDGFALVASVGGDGAPELPQGVLRQVAASGTELCIDLAERPSEGCIALPLPAATGPAGVLYLRVPHERMAGAPARLDGLRIAAALLGIEVTRGRARAELRRTRLGTAAGVEWPPHAEGFRATSHEIVAHDPAMRRAVERLERFATEGKALVVRGETGVGKERAARRQHAVSSRRRGPFLRVACGVLPEEDERSSLFGAGEDAELDGARFDLADGGTVYFDEITSLGRASQSALAERLRATPRCRIVLGTRRPAEGGLSDLDPALAELLAGTPAVDIPPLRDRPDDIVPLAQELTRTAAAAVHRRVLGLSMDACRALRDYAWPGNVRELRSVVERAVLLARDPILDVELFPFDITGGRIDLAALDALGLAREKGWHEAKQAFERVYFAEVFRAHDRNVVQTAKHAKIARKNLYLKLRQHGLVPK